MLRGRLVRRRGARARSRAQHPRCPRGIVWLLVSLVRVARAGWELGKSRSPIGPVQGGRDCLWDRVGTWLSCVLEEHADPAQNPDGMEWAHSVPEQSQALYRGEVGPEGVLRETHDLSDLLWMEEASGLRCVDQD